ncbi:MAG: PQQ-binding-like beta-propeller repeat protein [Pseudomonadales bacterium]
MALAWVAGTAHAEDCTATQADPGLTHSYAAGWGIDERNTRYQPDSEIRTDNIETLKLQWVYGLADSTPRSYPAVTEDTIFIGDSSRGVVALDRRTGCERWLFEQPGEISSAILRGRIGEREILIFNDRTQGVFAIDAKDGALIWHTEIEDEPIPWYSGTPLVTQDSVYVPISSLEVALAANPLFGCCQSSGGMAALDIATGKKRWYLPTIEAPAQETGSHWGFVQKYGPSGAPVWAAPSFDAQTGVLFFGTGQNYSHPTTGTSDALFAVQVSTGKVEWVEQYTANDAYTAACNIKALNHPNCPKPSGPDVDFGAATLLLKAPSGRKLLVAGQKSADIHALDPATQTRVWTTNLGRGGIIGGVHWGLAANESLGLVFAPISDKAIQGFPSPGDPKPGLYALEIETGQQRWSYSRESRCDEEPCVYGLSAALLASNDLVISASMDGYIEAFAAASGERVWSYDAWQDYSSANGVATSGGAFDAHGPMIAGDQLIITSGYGYVGRQRGGNALLVFALESGDE